MTKEEAITFLNNIKPEPVHMMTIDPVKWEDFKASVITILEDPNTDPKYKQAVEDILAIANTTLGV